MSDHTMQHIHPLLIVEDVSLTADYYRTKLGFEFFFPEKASAHLAGDFAMLKRDNVILMFKAVKNGMPRPNRTVHEWLTHDAFIVVEDLESLCDELRGNGVTITKDIETTAWGTREFHFEDNNGYVFCCGHAILNEND